MSRQLVSVIMPAFNASRFIEESVRSILAQSHKNLELIVCDDCSSDKTSKVVSNLALEDSRVKFISNDANLGIAKTRNKCIEIALGDVIAFCDSDDVWHPKKLETQLSVLNYKKYAVICSNCLVINQSGEVLKARTFPEVIDFFMMRYRNFIINSSAIYYKPEAPLFFTEIKHEDYLFWLKLVGKREIFCVQKELVKYRVHSDNVTKNKLKSFFWHYHVWRANDEDLLSIVKFFCLNIWSRLRSIS
jgi:glycosyltransferase involved in cell wall biosynthesis